MVPGMFCPILHSFAMLWYGVASVIAAVVSFVLFLGRNL